MIRDFSLDQLKKLAHGELQLRSEHIENFISILMELMKRPQIRSTSQEVVSVLVNLSLDKKLDPSLRILILNRLEDLMSTWFLSSDYYEHAVSPGNRDYFRTKLERAARYEKDEALALRLSQVSFAFHHILGRDLSDAIKNDESSEKLFGNLLKEPFELILDPQVLDRVGHEIRDQLKSSKSERRTDKLNRYLNFLRFSRDFSFKAANFFIWNRPQTEPNRGVEWTAYYTADHRMLDPVVRNLTARLNGPFDYRYFKDLITELVRIQDEMTVRIRAEESLEVRLAYEAALTKLLANNDYLIFREMMGDIHRINSYLEAAGAEDAAFEEFEERLMELSRSSKDLLNVREAQTLAKVLRGMSFAINFSYNDEAVDLSFGDKDDESSGADPLSPASIEAKHEFIRHPELLSALHAIEVGDEQNALIWLTALHMGFEVLAKDADPLTSIYAQAVLAAIDQFNKQ